MPQSVANVLLHVVFSTSETFIGRPATRAFSVSQSNAPQVKAYIANQEEHHRKVTFQDELRLLLKRHEIDFDERYYVWD